MGRLALARARSARSVGEEHRETMRSGEPDITFADTGAIQKTLGWKPKVKFEEGVRNMLENIDLWRDAPVWNPESISVATKDWFKYLDDGQRSQVSAQHD